MTVEERLEALEQAIQELRAERDATLNHRDVSGTTAASTDRAYLPRYRRVGFGPPEVTA